MILLFIIKIDYRDRVKTKLGYFLGKLMKVLQPPNWNSCVIGSVTFLFRLNTS